jgi:hypothetical protein
MSLEKCNLSSTTKLNKLLDFLISHLAVNATSVTINLLSKKLTYIMHRNSVPVTITLWVAKVNQLVIVK